MKTCSKCKVSKPLNEFHNKTASKDGKQANCKNCNNELARTWQGIHPEAFEEIWRRHSYGEKARLKKRARLYGLSPEQLEKMLIETQGKCDICSQRPRKYLVVDHCHKTGKVRGILCEDCNRGIGLLKESKEVFESAMRYLEL